MVGLFDPLSVGQGGRGEWTIDDFLLTSGFEPHGQSVIYSDD